MGFDGVADEVVCLETPGTFRSVGAFYRQFDGGSDVEANDHLHAAP